MISSGYHDSFLFDSCAIAMLWDRELQQKRWAFQAQDVLHKVCEVVCYEVFQQRASRQGNGVRERFEKYLRDKKLEFVERSIEDCHVTANLAVAVREDLKGLLDEQRQKERFRVLYHDILIAGLALSRGNSVFTDDPVDWEYLQEVVAKNYGTFGKVLNVVSRETLLDR